MKKKILGLVAGIALLTTSCLGPNRAFNGLNDWNDNLSENRWANEAVFIGLNIVPVYGLAYLGDILIFNSIEFWGGENPIGDGDDM
ncbi:MAG TPA: DUF3332 family protein [Planctomycetes bacterium]|nr:DUF3332 family protein [Planctomycetota bacterium]